VVVRYPHTATVTVTVTTVTDGEYASETPTTSSIKGRFEPSGGATRVKNPNGEFIEVTGKFFTKAEVITGADTLAVDGMTFKILKWITYQNYSEIWLD